MKMKYSIKSTYYNVSLLNIWYIWVIIISTAAHWISSCSASTFYPLTVSPTTHVFGLFIRAVIDTHFSHTIPGPKYIERIGRNTLNCVTYDWLVPPLGSFWAQNLKSEEKLRNLVANPVYSTAVTCHIFGHQQGDRVVLIDSRGARTQ